MEERACGLDFRTMFPVQVLPYIGAERSYLEEEPGHYFGLDRGVGTTVRYHHLGGQSCRKSMEMDTEGGTSIFCDLCRIC